MQQLVVVHGQDVAVIDVDVTFLSATCGTRRAVRTRPSQVAPLYPLTQARSVPMRASLLGYRCTVTTHLPS